jgi:hypothetical protein
LQGFALKPRFEARHDKPRREREQSNARQASSGSRKAAIDPWFLKPYESASSGATNSAAVKKAPLANAANKPKPKLAFLLGGAPK